MLRGLRDIDVPVSRVAGVIAGERAITADTALGLASYVEIAPELWLKLQSNYSLQIAGCTVWP